MNDRAKALLIIGGAALAGAALWRVGVAVSAAENRTDPYAPLGSTENAFEYVVKGARQVTTRPQDFWPALVAVNEEFFVKPVQGLDGNVVSGAMDMTGAARGIRNNNPGNIRQGLNGQYIGWQGSFKTSRQPPFTEQVGDRFYGVDRAPGGPFAIFDTMFHGMRAMIRNMWSIVGRTDGKVGTLIATWAPSSENNVGAYVATVERLTGLSANSVIDRSNVSQMGNLAMAMSIKENGENNVRRYAPVLLDAMAWARAAEAAGIVGTGKTS